MPGVGFEPTPTCVEGGLRLHNHIRLVASNPSNLLTSAARVRRVLLIRSDPPRIAESRAGIVQALNTWAAAIDATQGNPLTTVV